MSQLSLVEERRPSLEEFFEHIDRCRDKNPLTHSLHPYPAKFIPHVPRVLLEEFCVRGAVVLDSMCGSGTTLVEAAAAGFDAIGCDLNPVALIASRAKTTILEESDRRALRGLLRSLRDTAATFAEDPQKLQLAVAERDLPAFLNRSKWFSDTVLRELAVAQRLIQNMDQRAACAVALCAFSAIVVPVSNQESETRWCAKPKELKTGAVLGRLAKKIAVALKGVAEFNALNPARVRLLRCDARHLPLEASTIDLAITSPPYANSHDYYLYNKLRLFWLGHDVRSIQALEIGSRNQHSDLRQEISSYLAAMEGVLSETHRVLKPRGVACIVVADALIRGTHYDMGEGFSALGEKVGFTPLERYSFSHRRFNASFQRGFGRADRKMTHVIVFRRGR